MPDGRSLSEARRRHQGAHPIVIELAVGDQAGPSDSLTQFAGGRRHWLAFLEQSCTIQSVQRFSLLAPLINSTTQLGKFWDNRIDDLEELLKRMDQ